MVAVRPHVCGLPGAAKEAREGQSGPSVGDILQVLEHALAAHVVVCAYTIHGEDGGGVRQLRGQLQACTRASEPARVDNANCHVEVSSNMLGDGSSDKAPQEVPGARGSPAPCSPEVGHERVSGQVQRNLRLPRENVSSDGLAKLRRATLWVSQLVQRGSVPGPRGSANHDAPGSRTRLWQAVALRAVRLNPHITG